jgi:2-alkyl-3-oxoalkanoate reductase
MRIFVTGASGAVARHLVPGLVAAGYEVTVTTRAPGKVARSRQAGSDGGPAPCCRVPQLSYASSR